MVEVEISRNSQMFEPQHLVSELFFAANISVIFYGNLDRIGNLTDEIF